IFSSRRRHTRSKRDWSSDVCSSDLSDTIRPTVQYVVDDTMYEFTSPIGQSPRLRPGKKVGVYYNPNNPKQAMIDTFTQRGTISKFAGYIFIGFGLVFLYILLVQLIVE